MDYNGGIYSSTYKHALKLLIIHFLSELVYFQDKAVIMNCVNIFIKHNLKIIAT